MRDVVEFNGTNRIDRNRAKALEWATAQEMGLGDDPMVGYSARVWAQVSLPYRDPGDVDFWERKNGSVILTMRPALLRRPDGTRYNGFAYGLLPRTALIWIASEAVRTQNPVLELGPSLSKFMEKIGMVKGGRDAGRLTEQLRRLFKSQLSVEGIFSNQHGTMEREKFITIAEEFRLWTSNNDDVLAEQNPGLWSSRVELSRSFFNSIVQAPIPVNVDAMRALGSSPMRLDIYLWATYRVFHLERPARMKWDELNQQFGGQYATVRQFKAQFIKNLQAVKIVYPELNVEVTQEYLILKPSAPHVTPTKRRVELV